MSPPKTEYSFTLPIGLPDGEGTHHREGTMRLATARDEIEPLRDARVRENGAYANVLRLARVITKVGDIKPVTPAQVEQLYAADFAHLQRLYEQVNSAPTVSPERGSSVIAADAAPSRADPPSAASPMRPRALAGMSDAALNWMLGSDPAPSEAPAQQHAVTDALPIVMRQQRERSVSRETLMRSAAPPRRGRVTEGTGTHADEHPSSSSTLSTKTYEGEVSGERLMRLSSRPPAQSAPVAPSTPAPVSMPLSRSPTTSSAHPAGGNGDMEDVYEQMIARLRRELLVERERMGAPFDA